MSLIRLSVAGFVASALAVVSGAGEALPDYRNARLGIERRVEDLLGRMTLEEKVGQLNQVGGLTLGIFGIEGDAIPNADKIKADVRAGRIGSFVVKMRRTRYDARETHDEYQKVAVEESRLGIPLLFADDIVHGCFTTFPTPLALACSFRPDLFEKAQRCAAIESRWAGYDWVFGPVADVARDPRWGRIAEGCGEDPYLASLCVAAQVRGLQGDGNPDLTVAACLKHFVGYSDSAGGRDYNISDFSEWTLRNVHLPPFRAGVEAGAETIMSGFNTVDGVPTSLSRHTLQEILRDQWGFAGCVVSDAGGLSGAVTWNYAGSREEAARMGLEAGADIDMYANVYAKHAADLVRRGQLKESDLDACVRRVLAFKFRRGLFEKPYLPPLPADEAEQTARFRALAKECAARSAVLLKNDGTLPLKPSIKSVALIGPYGASRRVQLGCWPGRGIDRWQKYASPMETLSAVFPEGMKVLVENGCADNCKPATISRDSDGAIIVDRSAPQASSKLLKGAVLATIAKADVIVMMIGETSGFTGEGGSRISLGLTGRQQELFDLVAAHADGKPIVSYVLSGRPLVLPEVWAKSSAVIYAFQPGSQGFAAMADLLTGKSAPEGRLSVSVPKDVGQLPCTYNRYNTGHPTFPGYRDCTGGLEPMFPFGFGLTYTKFEYGPTSYDQKTRVASCVVRNVGAVAGVEKPQLYIRQLACRGGVRPLREFRGVNCVDLKPGESATVTFAISDETLRYQDRIGGYVTEKGRYELKIAPDAVSGKMVPFVW